MKPLWHYTCDHGREAIGDRGTLVPANELVRPGIGVPWTGLLVWMTDLPTPNRNALGLTMNLTTCDRTAYRYRVTDRSHVMPWMFARSAVSVGLRSELEAAPGARPRHWYVATRPVPVIYDPR